MTDAQRRPPEGELCELEGLAMDPLREFQGESSLRVGQLFRETDPLPKDLALRQGTRSFMFWLHRMARLLGLGPWSEAGGACAWHRWRSSGPNWEDLCSGSLRRYGPLEEKEAKRWRGAMEGLVKAFLVLMGQIGARR